ncbi:MAG: AAA family ATPase, partial [Candidatus Neomarinimicrobiota bacterium]
FKSIGLKSDPFTTSPNVEKFYPATEHRQCLEGLELSVRLRRGLSVIRGGIGVGKTTVSRKLMEIFRDESDTYEFHLIHDPKFETELIFLKHIIDLFGIKKKGDDVQSCRNIVENYLLKAGVDDGKVIVLIVDEGQNLPEQMIDVFRTLLNFETDEYKLLQLIIFGQPEMTKMLSNYPNFEDRIAFNFELGPVSLEDTRGLIDYRIKISGEENQAWFSDGAIKEIHKITDGFPRKMTQLCHQLLLSMIGEERDSIDADMVKRVSSGQTPDADKLKKISSDGEFDDIAVNKLLDVLRKKDKRSSSADSSDKKVEKSPPEEIEESTDELEKPHEEEVSSVEEIKEEKNESAVSASETKIDDDWIGDYETDNEAEDLEESEPIEEAASNLNEGADLIGEPEEENYHEDLTPQVTFNKGVVSQDPVQEPGEYDHGFDTIHTIFDPASIGVHLDGNQITSILLGQTKGRRTLLAYDFEISDDDSPSFLGNESSLEDKLQNSLRKLKDKFFPLKELHGRALGILDNQLNTHFSQNDEKILVKFVPVGKDAKKNRADIIKFTLGKKLPYPAEDAILNIAEVNKSKDKATVGVANRDQIESISDVVSQSGVDVRDWMPVAQSVFNAFKCNYSDQNIAGQNNALLHIGFYQSVIVSCQGLNIVGVETLLIGYNDILSALKENGLSDTPGKDYEMVSVPNTFLSNQGITSKKGIKEDPYLRPVFELWGQEIERFASRVKRNLSLNDSSKIYISGYAGKIENFDIFVSSFSQIDSGLLNPVRNITFSPYDIERNSIPFHPTLLTAPIGSVLGDGRSITVLPPSMIKNNMFRWATRFVSIAAVLLGFFLGYKTLDLASTNKQIELDLIPAQVGARKLNTVEDEYSLMIQNNKNVDNQIEILEYDMEYFDRVIAITRFLSNRLPAEITLEKMSFQQGWEKELLRMQGRALQSFIEMEDENKRIVRMVGNLEANPALKDRYFNNFIQIVEESELFSSVEVVEKNSESDLGPNNIQFDLKCVF